jgi:hypothetical protein
VPDSTHPTPPLPRPGFALSPGNFVSFSYDKLRRCGELQNGHSLFAAFTPKNTWGELPD